ncbi:MAG: beta-galactosidase [Candidatus Hydrogenedentes bacterium]|nr:beta-galactosidase [Candidatus Hydrogenedentota bacterium]
MLRFGATYCPEQWTPEETAEHIKLMVKARVNVVRMGEFAWCTFEPEQGRFRFEWMDRAVEAFHKEGIDTVLATPTAVPPMWVFAKHPHVLHVDAHGLRSNPGARHHCCMNAPEYLLLCDAIVQELARHYANVPGVLGWQLHSSPGCHGTVRCYCEHCEKAFRQWLLAKYETIEHLNEAWGSAFWGFTFRNWSDIPLPRATPDGPNPGHWLDFARFSSGTHLAFCKRQRGLIRHHCAEHFITLAARTCSGELDYAAHAELVDFLSWDNAPALPEDAVRTSYHLELTRSFKGMFWTAAQPAGPSATAGVLGEAPAPGDLRRWAWQTVANGADGVCFHPWRTARQGAEQLLHGVLDWDGAPRRRYKELARTGEEFANAGGQMLDTRVDAKVALLRSYEIGWTMERQPGAAGFDYDAHCVSLYRAVKRTGHVCDIVSPNAPLSGYAAAIAPCLAIADEALAAQLEAYVKEGGTLVFTPQSGSRTAGGARPGAGPPGALQDLAGARVDEILAYPEGGEVTLNFSRGALIAQQCKVGRWLESLECTTAQPVAEYAEGRLKGKAAITQRIIGKGHVYYLGAYLPQDMLERFVGGLMPEYRIKGIPDGVEITQRRGKDGRFVFVINHSGQRQTLPLPGTFPDLLTGQTVGPVVTVSANGILVLKA